MVHFDALWKGVSVDTLLAAIETEAGYLTAWSDGGYTTSLPLEDVTDGEAWIAYEYDGSRLTPSTAAGPPPRAAPVLLEKREMGTRPDAHAGRRASIALAWTRV